MAKIGKIDFAQLGMRGKSRSPAIDHYPLSDLLSFGRG
jgi:hypothetical protein